MPGVHAWYEYCSSVSLKEALVFANVLTRNGHYLIFMPLRQGQRHYVFGLSICMYVIGQSHRLSYRLKVV